LSAVAEQLSTASAKLSLVAVASLLLVANAVLLFVALAMLLSRATAVLPSNANAWEVESEKQLLVPFWTLVSPLLLTHVTALGQGYSRDDHHQCHH
jgi:hypothetical protein